MTKVDAAKAKAIRASRRIQGLEVPHTIEPTSGITTSEQPQTQSTYTPQPAQSTSKLQDEVQRNLLEENESEDSQPDEDDEARNPANRLRNQILETEPRISKNFIGHVPIPYPVGPIRAPRSDYKDSSSDGDDPEDDFLDNESSKEEEVTHKSISPDDSSAENSPSHKNLSASLGSSNNDQTSSDSESTSSSSSESESGSESDTGSDSSDRKSKKDKKRKRIAKVKKQLKEAKDELKRLSKLEKGKATSQSKKEKSKSRPSSKKKKKRKGIQVEIGVIPNSNLIQLQPFRREQMKKLHSSIPLTVFDQSFALADSKEYDRQHHSSSSKTTKNKGLDAPSEYKMSYGEWTENISLFKRYLIMHKHPEVAERINYHIKNVKQVKRSTECWMTALRYDILCRKSVFVEREDKHPIKDIGSFMKKYEEKAKDKSLNFGETNGGEANPYAKGGRLEFKHPETGQPIGYPNQHQQQISTTNVQPVASGSREHNFRGRRRAPRPPRTLQYQQYPYHQNNPSTYHNNLQPSQYQPFQALPQNPLPTIHMGFQTQGSTSNTTNSNIPASNFSSNSTKFPSRGNRGSWRGGRGGGGRQGQLES